MGAGDDRSLTAAVLRLLPVLGKPAFGIERCHAAGACGNRNVRERPRTGYRNATKVIIAQRNLIRLRVQRDSQQADYRKSSQC